MFNILFVSTNKKGDHLVHCHKCVQQVQSRNKKATFTVLQQVSGFGYCSSTYSSIKMEPVGLVASHSDPEIVSCIE